MYLLIEAFEDCCRSDSNIWCNWTSIYF